MKTSYKLHIPTPPDPTTRKERMPWQFPKAEEDDSDALEKINRLIEDPAYQQADLDMAFLHGEQSHAIRLQMDFYKPEWLLQQSGIEETIVAFGGAKIAEPAESERNLKLWKDRLEKYPDNEDIKQRVKVAEKRLAKSQYYEIAYQLGERVGKAFAETQVVMMTGGGPGIMEAANRGASVTGAPTVGLNITLPHEQFPNPYITPGLCFKFHYFAIRKMHFLSRAKALVAFPGGFGTLDELFETLTLIQTRKMPPLPIILVGQTFWNNLINFEYLADEGLIAPEDLDLFWFAESADEIWEGICQWHQNNGTPLDLSFVEKE